MQVGQIVFSLFEFPLQVGVNVFTSFAHKPYTASGCY